MTTSTTPGGAQTYDPVSQTWKAFTPVQAAAAPSTNIGTTAPATFNQPGTPGYNPQGAVYTGATATPSPTISSLYGSVSPTDSTIDNLTGIYAQQANAPVDEQAIRDATTRRLQTEIDATNRIYDQKLSQAKVTGANNEGSATAINARRGLIGSDFGNSLSQGVVDKNNAVYSGIGDERQLALASITDKGLASATAEIAAKNAAKQQGAQNYITFLAQQETRKTARTTDAAKAALAAGYDLSTGSDLKAIADSYQISPDALRSAYIDLKASTEKAALEAGRAATAATDTHNTSVSTIENNKATQALAQKKFEEDKRQFGLKYAQDQQKIDIEKTKAGGSTSGLPDSSLRSQPAYKGLSSPQKTAADGANTLLSSLKDYRDAYAKMTDKSGGNYFGADSATLASKQAALVFQYSVAAGSGAVQKADADQIAKIIPNPTTVGGVLGAAIKGGQAGGLSAIDGQIEKFTRQLQNYGLTPTELNASAAPTTSDPLGLGI
jgi:hypothetical protein